MPGSSLRVPHQSKSSAELISICPLHAAQLITVGFDKVTAFAFAAAQLAPTTLESKPLFLLFPVSNHPSARSASHHLAWKKAPKPRFLRRNSAWLLASLLASAF